MAPIVEAYEPATAINNFSSDYTECAVYYSIGAEGLRRGSNPNGADRSEQASKQAFLIASMFAEPEAVAARMQLYTKEQASIIKNDYANLSILTVKYGDSCKTALDNPRARLVYWLSKKN
jgi:hypothetical protein